MRIDSDFESINGDFESIDNDLSNNLNNDLNIENDLIEIDKLLNELNELNVVQNNINDIDELPNMKIFYPPEYINNKERRIVLYKDYNSYLFVYLYLYLFIFFHFLSYGRYARNPLGHINPFNLRYVGPEVV